MGEEISRTTAGKWSAESICKAFRIHTDSAQGAADLQELYLLLRPEVPVAVYSQQCRALNLVGALAARGTLNMRKGENGRQRICEVAVVGAGAAGLTAAVGSALAGAKVTILEKASTPMSLQLGCEHRFLHPRFHHWPEPRSHSAAAALPFLTWSVGTAADVANTILDQFQQLKARMNENGNEALAPKENVYGIEWEPSTTGYRVTFNQAGAKEKANLECDVLIFAVGFGVEKTVEGLPPRSYWRTDPLTQRSLASPGQELHVLVAGDGDGGTIDVLRACLRDFDHGPFIDRVIQMTAGDASKGFRDAVLEADKMAADLKERHSAPARRISEMENELKKKIVDVKKRQQEQRKDDARSEKLGELTNELKDLEAENNRLQKCKQKTLSRDALKDHIARALNARYEIMYKRFVESPRKEERINGLRDICEYLDSLKRKDVKVTWLGQLEFVSSPESYTLNRLLGWLVCRKEMVEHIRGSLQKVTPVKLNENPGPWLGYQAQIHKQKIVGWSFQDAEPRGTEPPARRFDEAIVRYGARRPLESDFGKRGSDLQREWQGSGGQGGMPDEELGEVDQTIESYFRGKLADLGGAGKTESSLQASIERIVRPTVTDRFGTWNLYEIKIWLEPKPNETRWVKYHLHPYHKGVRRRANAGTDETFSMRIFTHDDYWIDAELSDGRRVEGKWLSVMLRNGCPVSLKNCAEKLLQGYYDKDRPSPPPPKLDLGKINGDFEKQLEEKSRTERTRRLDEWWVSPP